MFSRFDRHGRSALRTGLTILTGLVALVICESSMGRSAFGPDGRFGWLSADVWSSEQSQRLIDPYSLSHIVHGVLFYWLIWLATRKRPGGVPLMTRFTVAFAIEVVWEILENSPIIINRYRAVTISFGYVGDSILNSLSDVAMMSLGFLFASRVKPWVAIAAVLAMELGMLLWVRDNLTLNIIMLLVPLEAIKQWQLAAQP